ncbi:MAG: hypothetical protein ACREJU_11810 [Nitrospiraceae bacterium]
MLDVELQVIGILITLAFLWLMSFILWFVKPGVPIEIWRNQHVLGSDMLISTERRGSWRFRFRKWWDRFTDRASGSSS